jgi:RimJ/RimL family protein N-acetyltransferase
MKTGKMVGKFTAKDGRKVVLRTLRWEDLDDLLELINSLVDEKADIIVNKPVSREFEIEWLSRALCRLEKDETLYLVAEVNGKVVANSEVSKHVNGYDKHAGMIGIAIHKDYRDVGIGTKMMKALIDYAKKEGLKVLMLTAFANNKRAIRVYEKNGFVQTGKIPKRFFKEGKFVDEIIMTKMLE